MGVEIVQPVAKQDLFLLAFSVPCYPGIIDQCACSMFEVLIIHAVACLISTGVTWQKPTCKAA